MTVSPIEAVDVTHWRDYTYFLVQDFKLRISNALHLGNQESGSWCAGIGIRYSEGLEGLSSVLNRGLSLRVYESRVRSLGSRAKVQV
mmetsp:Transcript_32931/g.51372  ORF Transcript_32931/g.51372 Transcript_32931/m.51372 type:complete len:87 (+) Transcript_32931:74-334(+)